MDDDEDTDARGEELDRLVRTAVDQTLEHVRKLVDGQIHIPPLHDYPQLGAFDSGQPSVNLGKGPPNYQSAFQVGKLSYPWEASFDDFPALGELARLVHRDDALRRRLVLPGVDRHPELAARHIAGVAGGVALDLLARLLHTIGVDFSDDEYEAAWRPVRDGLLLDELPIEIVVPICMATFERTEPLTFGEIARLELLSEGERRARVPTNSWGGGGAQGCVLAAATHAITFSGYVYKGHERMEFWHGEQSWYPLTKIEQAFQALRISSDVPLGYAQIYVRPKGWAWDYRGDLPPVLHGPTFNRYPPDFDNWGWLQDMRTVAEPQFHMASQVFADLLSAPKSYRLASRRFSNAALRGDDDDVVLDLCIALEAALGDKAATR